MTATCDRLPVLPQLRSTQPCIIDAAIKKRNGDPYWWCHTHGKEVHAGNGDAPSHCSGADSAPICDDDVFELDLADYPGGVAAWGATPPVATWGTGDRDEGGVHVHARATVNGTKAVDRSVTILRVISGDRSVDIDEESAKAYMITAIAGLENVVLQCPRCGWLHLDRDIFAIGPHRKHVCNRCGRSFWAHDLTISNPALAVRDLDGVGAPPPPRPARRHLHLSREEVGGFAIWGSNPAIFWTFPHPESEGIHAHVWDVDGDLIEDETFGAVTIDGNHLDPQLVRLLMAQQLLFGPSRRVDALQCPHCDQHHTDLAENAFVPTNHKVCSSCGRGFTTPGRRLMVSNPLVALLRDLE